jgi:DNA-binding HxlR family transcriptional regulator
MLGRKYVDQNCSVARALEVVGERWSLLIIRDAVFGGTTRFQDFQRRLGLAPNILKSRLDNFVENGVMERRQYSRHPEHYEYVLTEKGHDLHPIVIALAAWGDRWAAPQGPPVVFRHSDCGTVLEQQIHCPNCGEVRSISSITASPGPGLPPGVDIYAVPSRT